MEIGGVLHARTEGGYNMNDEPKILLPTPVMIRTNSLSNAWELAVHTCIHKGKPSSPDYKTTPTLRINMKLIIDNPMEGFYESSGRVSPRVLHHVFREPGIITQGAKGLYAYIEKMSRKYAAEYMDMDPNEREPYCYPARLMYYPLTDKLPNALLSDIEKMILNESRTVRFGVGYRAFRMLFRGKYVELLSSLLVRSIYDLVRAHNDEQTYINQLNYIRLMLPERQGSRRIKAQLWIPQDDLCTFEDQPCLQDIFFENLGGGDVHIEINFRSWDLFNGLPFNLPGILNLIYKEVLEPNGMRVSRLTCNGRDAHIYQANIEDAKTIAIPASDVNKIVYL